MVALKRHRSRKANCLPLLTDAVGGVECEVVGSIKHGDHTVFVGEVKTARLIADGEALNLASTGWNYGG